MRLFIYLTRKKRAISPVVSVILLIGLAVAAVAAIFIVVLPLFQPTTDLEISDAFIVYDTDYTKTMDRGIGYGKGTVILTNAGTGSVKVVSIKIYYATPYTEIWNEISQAISIQGITTSEPYIVNPLATNEELNIRFPIPSANIDDTVLYKIVITTDDDVSLDTSKTATVSETDMQLSADRPQIIFSGTSLTSSGYIRRTYDVGPSTVKDNSAIKNVTYSIYNSGGTFVMNKTITSSLWKWRWETYDLPNGSYSVVMTVYDYAGLSDSTDPITFTIDNDYIDPTIRTIIGSSQKHGNDLAEIGEFFTVQATITDSGCEEPGISKVQQAILYYKLNGSLSYTSASMSKVSGNNWTVNIPAAFIDSEALANNLSYYIYAQDDDTNNVSSNSLQAGVIDTVGPNFVQHTPAIYADEGISKEINATVEDKDRVESVTLWYRVYNKTGINPPGIWQSLTNFTGDANTWNFEIPNYDVTLEGLQYYIVAEDPTGNIANDGNATYPYYVDVPDDIDPVFDEWQQDIPSTITANDDLTVTVEISDNDRTFSWTSFETGQVLLKFKRKSDPAYTTITMSHISGDSSTGTSVGTWQGTIDGGNFTTPQSPVQVQVVAIDASGNEITRLVSVEVVESGVPILTLDRNSIVVDGVSDGNLTFRISNIATGVATATITDIQIMLKNSTKYDYITGTPYITKLITGGSLIWVNKTNIEGANNTKLTLDTTFDITSQNSATIKITFANSTGGYYNVNDFEVNATLYYEYGGILENKNFEFLTPITTFLFTDNWNSGTADNWLIDSRSDGSASFTVSSQQYVGNAQGSSTYNVWTWIDGQTFPVPFEIVLSFYSVSGSTNRMAHVIFANNPTDNTLYAAGARVGAREGRVSEYTVSSDTWTIRNSQSYDWGEDIWNLMKISVAADKTISVYSEDSNIWNLRAQYRESSLADNLYVGLFVDYAQTRFDNFTIYYYGDAPEPSDLPNPSPLFGIRTINEKQNSMISFSTPSYLKDLFITTVVSDKKW